MRIQKHIQFLSIKIWAILRYWNLESILKPECVYFLFVCLIFLSNFVGVFWGEGSHLARQAWKSGFFCLSQPNVWIAITHTLLHFSPIHPNSCSSHQIFVLCSFITSNSQTSESSRFNRKERPLFYLYCLIGSLSGRK